MPYYIRRHGHRQGPLSDAELTAMLSQGTVTRETIASLDNVLWRPLGEFPDYNRLVGVVAVPKPVPVPVGVPLRPPRRVNKSDVPSWLLPTIIGVLLLLLAPLVGYFIGTGSFPHRRTTSRKTEQEKGKAEAYAAAEQAEQEREEPTAKEADNERKEAGEAVAERRKRERKKADEQAAAEQAVRDQEAKEQAEQSQRAKANHQAALSALPDFWPDIALPTRRADEPVALADSQFLWNVNDRIKIDIVPFVDWENTEAFEIGHKLIGKHEIRFLLIDRDTPTSQPPLIIKFSLTDIGLTYQWEEQTLFRYNSGDFYRQLNRTLLSKLRVEFDGDVKDIALWTPVVFKDSEFQSTFGTRNGRPSFMLWHPNKGKEFCVLPKDDSPFLLDFDELTQDAMSYPVSSKQFDTFPLSLAYAPKIPLINGATGSCGLAPDRSTQRTTEPTMLIDFIPELGIGLLQQMKDVNERIKSVQEDIGETKKRSNKILSEIRRLENFNKQMSVKINTLRSHAALRGSSAEASALESSIQHNNSTIAELQYPLKELDDLMSQLNAVLDKLNGEARAVETAIMAEKAKWANVSVAQFSIDLVKTGTPPSAVGLPENRLPLLRVVKN